MRDEKLLTQLTADRRALHRIPETDASLPETAAYLRGETLPGDAEGWVVICADGCALGWAKGAGGVLKNHYPKGLRRLK